MFNFASATSFVATQMNLQIDLLQYWNDNKNKNM